PARTFSGTILFYQLQLLVMVLTFIVTSSLGRTCLLQFPYYASLLLPAVFLALGGQLQAMADSLDRRHFRFLSILACLALMSAWIVPPVTSYLKMHLSAFHLLPCLVVGLIGVLLLRLPQKGWLPASMAILFLASGQYLICPDKSVKAELYVSNPFVNN